MSPSPHSRNSVSPGTVSRGHRGSIGPSQLHRFLPLRGSAHFRATGETDGVSSDSVTHSLIFPMTYGVLAARTFPHLRTLSSMFAEPVVQPVRESGEFVQ